MKHILTILAVLTFFAGTAYADRYRSAESGRYVTPGYGSSHPSTTVREGR